MAVINKWSRKCQECGHIQKSIQPASDKELTDSYRNTKCRSCHSEGLDYGQFRLFDTEARKFVQPM